jgi:hypothetical protein
MKLLYYIASIGHPDLTKKINILLHNLTYIYNVIDNKFDIMINCYEEDSTIEHIIHNIKGINVIDNYFSYKKKGVLTELFLTNPNNTIMYNYDYIIFILDDVKIINLNIPRIIRLKKQYNIELLSPKIIGSTHTFMNIYNNITINNFLEIYLLILNPDELHKFFSLYTIENKWMWGVDLLFGYYNIRAGIINMYSAQHVLPSKSNKAEALELMNTYLKKIQMNNNIWKSYSPIRENINSVLNEAEDY